MRDDFDANTKETLAKRVGYRCSNPDCRKLTSGPRSDPEKVLNIGVAAHITAASEGGPRYDADLSVEKRRSVKNGIWLCQSCAKLVDNDVERYTVEVLREWKRRAEQAALREVEGIGHLRGGQTLDGLAKYEQTYLEQVRRECGVLHSEGVDRITAPLTGVFVMLEAARTLPAEIETDIAVPPDYPGRNEKAREERETLGPKSRSGAKERQVTIRGKAPMVVPLSGALQERQHLVILGDPGSGKTTLLQFVALCFATDGLAQEKLGLDENRMPIRIELRGYDGKEILGELLVKAVAKLGQFEPASEATTVGIARALLKRWLSERRAVLLLDGLDEVPGAQRAAVVRAITRFSGSEQGRSCRVVITSRIAGYRETVHIGAAFGCYTIRPFVGAEDALPYAAGWLKVLDGLPQEEAETQAYALLERLERGRDRLVMTNPLYLRLAVSFYAGRNQVPRDRVELYDYYINRVLMGRERERGEDIPCNHRQLGEALETVAWTLQVEKGKTITELAGVIEREVRGIEDGERLIGYLRERLGLLISYGYEPGEAIAFRHATFCAFFVAQRLKRAWNLNPEQTWKCLQPRLHHPDWREPILFLSAMLASEEATDLVERIRNAKSPYESVIYRDLLLAGKCLESGAKLGLELRRTIIDRLLQLYFEQGGRGGGWYGEEFQPIESVLSSLAGDDQTYLTASLLTIAEGKEHEPLARRARNKGKRNGRRPIAIQLVGDLGIRTPEVTSALLSALDVVALQDVAAEALGKVGPGTPEVMRKLIDIQWSHRQAKTWDQTVRRIVEALGLLGQRCPEVVQLLLDLAKSPDADLGAVRYCVTYALCKAAETDIRALEFVLEGWAKIHKAQGDATAWYALDEGIREGLRDGRKLFRSASAEVVHYLLGVLWNCATCGALEYDPSAADLLGTVIGDRPLVQCKVVEGNGKIRYHSLDLTEDLFSPPLLFQHTPYHSTGNFAFHRLTMWGISRPDIVVRLIQATLGADPWLLASVLEGQLASRIRLDRVSERCGKAEQSTSPLDQSVIEQWKQDIARLRSPDKAIRDAELNTWLVAAEEDYYLRHVPGGIERTKCSILNSAYSSVCHQIWTASKDAGSEAPLDLDPYVVAALACFRGCTPSALPFSLATDEIREEILERSRLAVSILHSRDRRSMEVLSSVVKGEMAEFFGNSLRKNAKDLERRKPSFQERIAAAYALAELTADYPEAQEVLISNLRPQSWGSGQFEETEFQQHLIRALGAVRSANRDLMAALLDVVINHGEMGTVWLAGDSALRRLSNPTPEAVALICERYEDLGKAGSLVQSLALKVLGTVEPYTEQVTGLFLKVVSVRRMMGTVDDRIRATKLRNAAAAGLGNLSEADPRVVEILLGTVRHTPEAAGALGNLASQVASAPRGSKLLRKTAKVLHQAIRGKAKKRFYLIGISSGCNAVGIAYKALAQVVGEITELEAKVS